MKWLQDNAMTIVISLMTLVATFSLYGYRIAALETRLQTDERTAAKLSDTVNSQNTQIQISLAKLEVDVEYIKAAIDKQGK